MYVLEPIIHETIWGGQKLRGFYNNDYQRVGHLYSVYCRDTMSNRILNETSQNEFFSTVFNRIKHKFNLQQHRLFPLTIALTEAHENLSIQVHPDDKMADSIEHGARGKRESWYFIDAPDSGYIYNGCYNYNKKELKSALDRNDFIANVKPLYVKPGDYIFVKPGTIHALTAGSLVYEIEEGGDFTYRLFDFNRLDKNGETRELHVEKGFMALNPLQSSEVKRYPHSGIITEETYITHKLVSTCQYVNTSNSLVCFTLINGHCICDSIRITGGMTVILLPNEMITGDIKLAFASKVR